MKTHYSVIRKRELCMVPREQLTVTERGLVVRLEKDTSFGEAIAMHDETVDLIYRGELKLTKPEAARIERHEVQEGRKPWQDQVEDDRDARALQRARRNAARDER